MFSKYIAIGITSQEAISNIFVIWFTILVSIGSILISVFFYLDSKKEKQKDLDIHNFALLEPEAIQNNILKNNNIKLNESRLHEEIWLEQGMVRYKFFVISPYCDYIKLVHDSLSGKKKQCIFCLVNKGKAHALGKELYILHKKKKVKDNTERYVKKAGCYIKQSFSDFSYIFPENENGKPLFFFGEDNSEYKEFYKSYRKEGFIVVVEYESVPSKKVIKQVYKANIISYKIGDKKRVFLNDFYKLTKEQVCQMIEKEFAEDIIKHSIF